MISINFMCDKCGHRNGKIVNISNDIGVQCTNCNHLESSNQYLSINEEVLTLPREVKEAIDYTIQKQGKYAVLNDMNNTYPTTKESAIIRNYRIGNYQQVINYLNSIQ